MMPKAAEGMGFLAVLRIMRLVRIFRIAKMGQYSEVFSLLTITMRKSTPMFVVMIASLTISCCLFGTMIWFTDRGTWFPPGSPELLAAGVKEYEWRGGYLRDLTIRQDKTLLDESPFLSIPHCMWWVIVTVTTAGYGCPVSGFPMTWLGNLVGAVTIVS